MPSLCDASSRRLFTAANVSTVNTLYRMKYDIDYIVYSVTHPLTKFRRIYDCFSRTRNIKIKYTYECVPTGYIYTLPRYLSVRINQRSRALLYGQKVGRRYFERRTRRPSSVCKANEFQNLYRFGRVFTSVTIICLRGGSRNT